MQENLLAELVAEIDQLHANAEHARDRVVAFAEHLHSAIRTVPVIDTNQVETTR
jgi:hypothetical protein